MRPDKIQWYLNIAREVSTRVACTRRQCGVILVKDDAIIATGYNGSVRGSKNCGEQTPCLKDLHNEAPLASYVHCPAVHGEENAIINAARTGASTVDATLYLYSSGKNDDGRPCQKCRQRIINAGIKDCYFMNGNDKQIYEPITLWITMENDWMMSEQKLPVKRCVNCREVKKIVTEDGLCQSCLDRYNQGIG